MLEDVYKFKVQLNGKQVLFKGSIKVKTVKE